MLIVIWRTQWLRLCFIYFHVAKSKNAQTLVITACKFVVLFIILTVETTWWSYPSCRLHFVNVGHIILINFHILDRRWKIYFYEPSRLFHVSCTFTSRSHLLLYFTLYLDPVWKRYLLQERSHSFTFANCCGVTRCVEQMWQSSLMLSSRSFELISHI